MSLRTPAVFTLMLCMVSSRVGIAADAAESEKDGAQVAMRAPFTLTLHVDREHYYEENIGEMPYVYEGGIYLMKGDHFGVSVTIRGHKITGIAYQPDLNKADVTFEFSQKVDSDGGAMMMLIIRNRTSHQLNMRALMTVPGEKGKMETSIIPIQAGLTNFESWPHAIVKLLLHDLRVGT
jgi:hypothetical protein